MADDYNIPAVEAWLRAFVDGFNFTLPGKDQNLGRDIAGVIIRGRIAGAAGGMQSVGKGGMIPRSTQHEGPDGSIWPANERRYAAWKERKYGWPIPSPGYRTAQMLSQASLWGRTTFAPLRIELKYGTARPPDRSYSPTQYMSPGDKLATDIVKADYFSEERPFWGVNDDDEANVLAEADEAMIKYIMTSG